jgi:hypothetical protein
MTGRQEYDRTKDRQRILGKYDRYSNLLFMLMFAILSQLLKLSSFFFLWGGSVSVVFYFFVVWFRFCEFNF